VPFAVYPGDSVTVPIAEQTPDTWRIAYVNNTTQPARPAGRQALAAASARRISAADR
jgi:hypothetical protein